MNSSLVNMAADPPESRFPRITAGWSWRYGPELNPPKGAFSARILLLDLEDHVLSQKLLVDVDVDTFTSKTRPLVA